MVRIGATKKEEAALREAALQQQSRERDSRRASSLLSSRESQVSTTDYESARSHLETDSEDEVGNITQNRTVGGVGNVGEDDTHSITTLQKDESTQLDDEAATELLQKEQQPTLSPTGKEETQDATSRSVDLLTNGGSNSDEESGIPYRPFIDVDDIATDPIPLARKQTIESLARSHKSFENVDSPYGLPFGPQPNYEIPESESYRIALTRTISRKSLSRRSFKEAAEKSVLAGEKKEEAEEEEEEEGVDPNTLEWDGPNDKDDPKNWSHARKWTYTMITASICLVVSLGSSLYVCGVPYIVAEFRISETLAISGLTFYLIGLAFGPVLAAPMSEVVGRRIVYITSLPTSMLFIMGVGLSKHVPSILVLRFFAGFFASPAMAVAGGTIADMWDFEHTGLAMAGFCLAPFMGPVLGPIIGGFVAENKGWKWTMWVNLMFAGVILIPVLLTPETYKPILLKKRAKKRGIKLAKPTATTGETLKFIFTITLMTPIKMLFVEPIVTVFSIYISFVFAVLFGFFEAYPIIFRGVYHMGIGISGLTFIGVMVGFILGTALYVLIDRLIFFPKNPDGTRGERDEEGKLVIPQPESRLILVKIGSIALPISLFWLAWTSRRSVHWISAVLAGVPFGFGLVLIFFATIIYFSMSYPPLSLASALAANNFFRYMLASVFPLFVIQMYRNLHIDWATTLFAFISLAMVPVPWVFEKWGPALRQTSTYGYAAQFKKAKEENARLERLQNEAEEEVLDEVDKEEMNSSSNGTDYNGGNNNRV